MGRARVAGRDRRASAAKAGHDDGGADNHELERHVDVHAFVPTGPRARRRTAPASTDVRVRGEELLANYFGWANRTLEASADPDTIPIAWRDYAFRGYLLLQKVDRRALEPWLPPAVFYNLMLGARRPDHDRPTTAFGEPESERVWPDRRRRRVLIWLWLDSGTSLSRSSATSSSGDGKRKKRQP